LPGTSGTEIAELWLNAVQEEIAHLIEYTGLTLSATGVADEAANWQQLRQAIFSSSKIDTAALTDGAVNTLKLDALAVTDAKVSDVSISKLTLGTLSLSQTIATIDYDLTMDVTQFELESDGAPGNFRARMFPDKVELRKISGASTVLTLEHDGVALSGNTGHIIDMSNTGLLAWNTLTDTQSELTDAEINVVFDDSVDENKARIIPQKINVFENASGAGNSALEVEHVARGIVYSGTSSPGIAAFRTVPIRQAVFEYTGTISAGVSEGSWQMTQSLVLTGIPKTSNIYALSCSFTGTTTGNTHSAPVSCPTVEDDGTDVRLTLCYIHAVDALAADQPDTSGDSVFVYVTYGANNL
jgi:hypothetical protein